MEELNPIQLFMLISKMDNLEEKGPRDRHRISLSEDWEVKYWCKTLAVSVKQLKEAVSKVGNSSAKVKEYLKTK
jgi:hypothetical protein